MAIWPPLGITESKTDTSLLPRITAMKTFSCLLLLALTTLGLTKSAEAAPPNTHAVVHIKNESNAYATIYYNFSKGYKWRKEVIQKGETLTLSYRYSGDKSVSPKCLVKIDVDTDGRNIFEYSLAKAAAPDDNDLRYGATYKLKQIPGTDTRFLEAASSKARVEIIEKNSFKPTTVN
jgi:hypothetical protein